MTRNKNKNIKAILFAGIILVGIIIGCSQPEAGIPDPVTVYINGDLNENEISLIMGASSSSDDKMEVRRLIQTVPHERQLRWHEIAFYAFVHYGINTFTST
ncbi:MAG: hypothetical protein FWF29_05895, partial [Treponema sp.]|nr:hypothetical protein [Treponema sp.]